MENIIGGLLTGPARTNLLVILGLWGTASIAWRLLGTPPTRTRPPRFWRLPADGSGIRFYAVPELLVALGFWLTWSTDTVWLFISYGGVVAVTAYAIHATGAGSDRASRARLAAILVISTLVELGCLLVVRLVIVPDPDDGFLAGLRPAALGEGARTVLLPLGLTAAALLLFRPKGRAFLARSARRVRTPEWLRSGRLADMPARAVKYGVIATFVLFAVPILGGGTGSAHLTFLGVATPEFGKALFLVILAVVVARHAHKFHAIRVRARLREAREEVRTGTSRRDAYTAVWRDLRHFAYPIGLFTIVAATSAARSDFGTLIPTFAATAAATWSVTASAAAGSAAEGGRLAQALSRLSQAIRGYRVFIWTGVVMVLMGGVVAFAFTTYASDRGKVWADPWAYRWDIGCVPATAPTRAPGVKFCQESYAANLESEHSQVSKALAAVADGGLWGRGVGDTASHVVPVGATDFILAVTWDKLGGLVVMLIAILVVTLAVALHRAAVPGPRAPPTMAGVLATALAALIAGQFLFVLAATVNLVPDSGIPAPFLSRGGQSNLALLLAVIVVLAVAPRPATEPAWSVQAPTAPSRRRVPVVALLAAMACLLLAVNVTLVPYEAPLPVPHMFDSARPICDPRANTRSSLVSPRPDPETCSTDRIAYDRTRVEVRFGGQPVLNQSRPDGTWQLTGAPGGLAMEDLTGLFGVPGTGLGTIDGAFDDIVGGTAGSTLAGRILPPGPDADRDPQGVLDVTIDPGLQHTIAAALRSNLPDGTRPLAGGVVVMDATTGQILAGATGPIAIAPVYPTVDEAPAKAFADDHDSYNVTGTGGALDGSSGDERCAADPSRCWKWSYAPDTTTIAPNQAKDLRRYVGDDPRMSLPPTDIDRAFGQFYGFGSTFKVVIAAAFLREGGRPDSRLDAPTTVVLNDQVVIHNFGGGDCPDVVDGQITLTQALSVSCNTAFVRLAQDLGWPAVAAQARRFGLRVGDCVKSDDWLTLAVAGVDDSCVPPDVDPAAIGNNALGGGAVQGTPLGMAAVMAAIGNGGHAVEPTLVTSTTDPATGKIHRAPDPAVREALPADLDDLLVQALSRTAVDGTAADLRTQVGMPIWVKTGTFEKVPDGTPLGPHEFVRYDSWLAGFVKTPSGRTVAFAAVVETRDEKAGATRDRFLVRALCGALS